MRRIPSVTRGGVEHEHVPTAFAIRRQTRHLKTCELDDFPILGPLFCGVVDRIVPICQLSPHVEHGRPLREALGQLVAQEVGRTHRGLFIGEAVLAVVGHEAVSTVSDRAVGVDETVRVQAVVRQSRIARRNRMRDGCVDRRHRLGMLGEVRTHPLQVGLSGLRIDPAGVIEGQQILGGPSEEARQRQRDDVGRRRVGQIELHRHASSVPGSVRRSRIPAAVREPDMRTNLATSQVCGPAELSRRRRRDEAGRAQHTLGVGGAVARMDAVDLIQRVHQAFRQVVERHGQELTRPSYQFIPAHGCVAARNSYPRPSEPVAMTGKGPAPGRSTRATRPHQRVHRTGARAARVPDRSACRLRPAPGSDRCHGYGSAGRRPQRPRRRG